MKTKYLKIISGIADVKASRSKSGKTPLMRPMVVRVFASTRHCDGTCITTPTLTNSPVMTSWTYRKMV